MVRFVVITDEEFCWYSRVRSTGRSDSLSLLDPRFFSQLGRKQILTQWTQYWIEQMVFNEIPNTSISPTKQLNYKRTLIPFEVQSLLLWSVIASRKRDRNRERATILFIHLTNWGASVCGFGSRSSSVELEYYGLLTAKLIKDNRKIKSLGYRSHSPLRESQGLCIQRKKSRLRFSFRDGWFRVIIKPSVESAKTLFRYGQQCYFLRNHCCSPQAPREDSSR